MKRRSAVATLLVPLLLGACGTARDQQPAAQQQATQQAGKAVTVADLKAGTQFNDTDVMFLQMLVHHQQQGLDMTATAARRSGNPQVKIFAQAVAATEKDELTLMKSWLTEWKKPVDVDTSAALHAAHGGLPATGPDEIKALTTVPADKFDTAFLNLFLAHQHNAMEMARLETADGSNAEVKKLAGRVTASRQGEVEQMLKLMNP